MLSKNGGLSAWEPLGAQEWLEVNTLTYQSGIGILF